MTLAALIAAYHEAEDPGGGLRATLTMAGRTLVERQARLAAAAGASPVVVAVERITSSLGLAFDRLRADGLNLVVARSVEEAAEAVHPDDRLLVIGDGILAPEAVFHRFAGLEGAAILTVPDVRADDRYERIDAQSRWAGLALLDGQLLQATAAMLNDWDLQSTLLRRAVQSGARQVSVRADIEDELPIAAECGEDLELLEAQIVAGAHASRPDWISRYLLAPLESAATAALLPTAATPTGIGLAGTLLMVLSGLAFNRHWLGLGLGLALLATPLDGIGERLALLRLQGDRSRGWWSLLPPLLAAGVLLSLAFALSGTRGWGCVALAGTILAFSLALAIEVEGREVAGSTWLAEPKGMAWLMLPFAVANLWGTGLTALAVYAGASFFWAQREVHRAAPRAAQD